MFRRIERVVADLLGNVVTPVDVLIGRYEASRLRIDRKLCGGCNASDLANINAPVSAQQFLYFLPLLHGQGSLLDLRAGPCRRCVEQHRIAHAELSIQLVIQICEVLAEHLRRELADPEEAPSVLAIQQFAELVESRARRAGVGGNLRQAKPGLQRVRLDQERLTITLPSAPTPADDILEARQPQVICNILEMPSDRLLELRPRLRRRPYCHLYFTSMSLSGLWSASGPER